MSGNFNMRTIPNFPESYKITIIYAIQNVIVQFIS